MTPSSLAARLTAIVVDHVEGFVERYAPGFALPTTFAGHPVGADVRADLAFTLGLLADLEVTSVAGSRVDDAIATVLRAVDGRTAHTFSSYRIAETVGRFGPFASNGLLASMSDTERRAVESACDSTEWIALLGNGLPANYAAVLTRCELARSAVGLTTDDAVVADLVDRTRRLLSANPSGYVDDSENGDDARYDVYSADIYLFTEPFADRLEPVWAHGARHVGALVDAVATRDGSALAWGRSLGALAVCHTIEYAALVLAHELTDVPTRWLARAENATENFASWTDGILITSHVRRAQDRYRGPDRWLQTTFDCLGKLAWSAATMLAAQPSTADAGALFPERDELLWFDRDRHAAVWTHRSRPIAFVVPFVGPAWADYLPAPRNPSLYEVPVDAPLPSFVPVVTIDRERYVAGGAPTDLAHHDGGVDATWHELTSLQPNAHEPLAGTRRAHFTSDRHVLRVHETLAFGTPPQAVSLQVTEAAGRPLRFDVETEHVHRIDVIDTDGIASYRSFWGELPRVHQVDIEPASTVDFTWSVRPLVRIATADPTHHYHRSLYDPLAGDVIEPSFAAYHLADPTQARARLATIDAFHLHWPEWFVETPEQAQQFVSLLRETETTLVWTQHNLRPHRDVDRSEELYQVFASAADLVIHHSVWGRDRVTERFRFAPSAHHVVLPHGHFGAMSEVSREARAEAEAELGLTPCAIRVGMVGAPRREKQTQAFMNAFARASRDDLQLLVLSLDGEEVPDDPRITARPYEFVDRVTYNRRLAAIDVIALPFAPDGEMLTTGVAADVVGLGRPALVSRWPYLREALGEAGITYEEGDVDLARVLDALSAEQLDRAAAASRALQGPLAWSRIAAAFLEAVVDVGAIKA